MYYICANILIIENCNTIETMLLKGLKIGSFENLVKEVKILIKSIYKKLLKLLM